MAVCVLVVAIAILDFLTSGDEDYVPMAPRTNTEDLFERLTNPTQTPERDNYEDDND